jgi:hypothetical protein
MHDSFRHPACLPKGMPALALVVKRWSVLDDQGEGWHCGAQADGMALIESAYHGGLCALLGNGYAFAALCSTWVDSRRAEYSPLSR